GRNCLGVSPSSLQFFPPQWRQAAKVKDYTTGSLFKSIGNLSSSTIATVITLIAELGRINAVSSLSVVRSHCLESQEVPLAAPKAEADCVY
ncbi:hypothetical protein NQZ68_018779, partial [Dissostichus eleginoides]